MIMPIRKGWFISAIEIIVSSIQFQTIICYDFFELQNGNSNLKSRGGEDTEHKGNKRNDKSKEQI